jgi:hypothetical protein
VNRPIRPFVAKVSSATRPWCGLCPPRRSSTPRTLGVEHLPDVGATAFDLERGFWAEWVHGIRTLGFHRIAVPLWAAIPK